MMIGNYTVEEINIIAMYIGATRTETLARISDALPDMDADIAEIAASAIRKLREVEVREYAESFFTPADETEG